MEKLAKKAMLDIHDVKMAWDDIEKTLKMADILQEIDTIDCIEPEAGVLRPDEVKECNSEGGYIIVPKVVGE